MTLTKPVEQTLAKNNMKHITPTKAALEQHVRRATCKQEGYVWGQLLLASPLLPPPISWGWIKNTEGIHVYKLDWATLPEASKVCYELISCKYKCTALKCTVNYLSYLL